MATLTSISFLLAFTLVAASSVAADDQGSQLPPFPCVPGVQRPPWLPPCSPPPPQPADCYPSVSGLMPCADFLTDPGVPAPAAACCDGYRNLVTVAPICICHVVNGDLGKLLPAPVLRLRMMQLPRMCRVPFPRATLRQCVTGPVPPMTPPPAPAPDATPPASPSTPPSPPAPTPEVTPPASPSSPPAASPPEEAPSDAPSASPSDEAPPSDDAPAASPPDEAPPSDDAPAASPPDEAPPSDDAPAASPPEEAPPSDDDAPAASPPEEAPPSDDAPASSPLE